jgi:hypothetical protein
MEPGPRPGTFVITIGDRRLVFCTDGPTLATIERKTGRPIAWHMARLRAMDLAGLVTMTFWMLQRHHGREFPNRAAVCRLIDDAGGVVAFAHQFAPAEPAGDPNHE